MRLPFNGTFPITQYFGENLNNYYIAEGLKGHQGIDFGMPNGTPLYSTVNGTVIAISKDIKQGEGVAILSTDLFNYKGQSCVLDTIYWHMKDGSILVNIGDKISVGQQIGLSNNTGQTTGPHLHFSVIPMYPDGSRKTIESYNNGYHACVDSKPFLDLPIFTKTLSFGMKDKEVIELQKKLGVIQTGYFWYLTLSAVKNFQKINGLVSDGVVGQLTRNKLNAS